MNTKPILVIGLNPAYQKTLRFQKLILNEVNRSTSLHVTASGKGANFAKAARNWNEVPTSLYQFAGGETGKKFVELLNDEGINHHTITVPAPTRTCTTCLCLKTGEMTELIEPAGEISEESVLALQNSILEIMPKIAGIAFCGTFPPGVTSEFYTTIANEAGKYTIPILLDAFKDIESLLEIGIDILKVNVEELTRITGHTDITSGIVDCFDTYPIKTIAITDGADRAYLADRRELRCFHIPRIKKVVNPLGAGDTVSAVFFSEFLKSHKEVDSFAKALCAGSASCESLYCGEFDKKRVVTLFKNFEPPMVSNL